MGIFVEKTLMKHITKRLKIPNKKLRAAVLIALQVAITASLAQMVRMLVKRMIKSDTSYTIAASSGGVVFGLSAFLMQDSLKNNMKILAA